MPERALARLQGRAHRQPLAITRGPHSDEDQASWTPVRQLISAIEAYLAERNLAPKRYLWHAKGEDVLAKILRARAALQHRPSA